jgi:hypothetical protein
MSPLRLEREKLGCWKDPELTGTCCDASALQYFHLLTLKLVNDAVRKGCPVQSVLYKSVRLRVIVVKLP